MERALLRGLGDMGLVWTLPLTSSMTLAFELLCALLLHCTVELITLYHVFKVPSTAPLTERWSKYYLLEFVSFTGLQAHGHHHCISNSGTWNALKYFLNKYVDWRGLLVATSEKPKFIKGRAGSFSLRFGLFFFFLTWLNKCVNSTSGAEVLAVSTRAHGSVCV